MKKIIVWTTLSLSLLGAGTLGYLRLTSQTNVEVQVITPKPTPNDALQRLLDEARQDVNTSGSPQGRMLPMH